MVSQMPVIIGGGAAVLLLLDSKKADASSGSSPPPSPQTLGGANMSSPVGIKTMALNTSALKGLVTTGGNGGKGGKSALVVGGINAETMLRQQIAALQTKAKAEYDKLSAEAKKAGAARLNAAIKPSPGLTGKETFEEASKKIGASMGAIAGVAACNALPIPGAAQVLAHTACASLGALAGAYLGEKVGDWAEDVYDEVKSWADSAWESVGDAADTVVGWIF